MLQLLTGALVLGAAVANAATVTYDWNVTWVTANPDGAYDRPTMGINGKWPLPQLNFTKGDRIIANVHNQLGNQSTSIHFHGFFQNGTSYMDGAHGVTQCGIPPGTSMTYNFTVEQAGTYWYHSHTRGQYPDGLRQMLTINDPEHPYKGQYDEQVAFTVSDWYHDSMVDLLARFLSVTNPGGAEPIPQAALLNDTQNFEVAVKPGKTYLFHLANVGAFAGQYFWIEGHKLQLVEIDGVYVQAAETDMIYLTAAQRYSFLVTTQNTTDTNFAMVTSMDTDMFDGFPEDLQYNTTGWLVYSDSAARPNATDVAEFAPYDDATLVPYDNQTAFENPTTSITLNMEMVNLENGANYASFNGNSYVAPKVPSLYTALSAGNASTDVAIYGDYTNSFVLEQNQVVEIVLNNLDPGKHPFHLHGHHFQVLSRGDDEWGTFDASNASHTNFSAVPARRDVLLARPNSFFVIRFRSDNPGVWLFHCHLEWHMAQGLIATLIEAPLAMQSDLVIPQNHLDVCAASATPTRGNAAGNTRDYTDLSGQNAPPGPLVAGWQPKGIVAMTFSVLSAVLGCAVIAWYGASPIKGLTPSS